MSSTPISLKLFEIGAIKFGSFKLKSGIESPIYIDLRLIASYPELLKQISQALLQKVNRETYDVLCGVPYGALSIATAMSLQSGCPLIIRRKETKSYGTKQVIEGVYQSGQRCLIIEDLITSGASILETAKDLQTAGLKITDAALIIDRQQGGVQHLQKEGIRVHALFTLPEILQELEQQGKLSSDVVQEVLTFLENQKTQVPQQKRILSYSERAQLATNPVAKKLFALMEEKETNLAFNPDVSSKEKFLKLVDLVGPFICVLKTHIDILEDFDESVIIELQKLAEKHNFLIFEDRKFADIGTIVQMQYCQGMYHIADWADITNAHILPGPGIIEGLKSAAPNKDRGLLLLAQMSSKGSLFTPEYTAQAVKLAEEHSDFVMGFICQQKLTDDPRFVHMTPGVHLASSGDAIGQQYNSPEFVIGTKETDVIIVGRGILQADNPSEAVERYRKAGWQAYQQRLEPALI